MNAEKSDNCFGVVDKEIIDSDIEQKRLNQLFEQGKIISNKDVEKFTPFEDPRIYGFIVLEINEANGFCAIKIGDTYRTVNIRLSEWRKFYANLIKIFDIPAYVDIEKSSETDRNETYIQRYYFRDYVIHRALREYGYRHLVYPKSTNPEIVYQGNVIIPENGVNVEKLSEEFMIQHSRIGEGSETIINETIQEINRIVEDIKLSIINGENKYEVSTTPYKKDENKTSDFSSMSELDYEKYPYQENASDDLVEKFIHQYKSRVDKTKPVKVLLDAPTRSGKTAMISWSLKDIFYKIWNSHNNNISQKELIVFTTGIPDVFYEFQEFIQRHKDVKNFITWLDRDDLIADFNDSVENPIDKAWQTSDVVAISASLQYLAGRKDDGAVKDLHKIIENRVSIVVADECHYGLLGNGESYKSSFKAANDKGKIVSNKTTQEKNEIVDIEIIEKELFSLNPKYGYIFASATTYNILDNDAFSNDNVVFVHQSDVDSERDKSFESLEQKGKPVEKSAFFGRVNRHFFGIDVGVPLNELFNVKEINDEKKNSKKFVFKNQAAYDVLDSLFGIGEYKNVPALMNNEVLRKAGAGRNILFQMTSRKACDALEEYFMDRKNKLGFNIMNTSSSDGNKPWTKAGIQKIKKEFHNRRFGKNIMITVNRGTTGVSIPQLDTEILLNNSSSLVRRVQTYGRVNTPWVETVEITDNDGNMVENKICYKPNTFVIDFDAAALYGVENDQEILNRNTNNKENSNDNTLIGTIWTFNGLTLSEMTQLDIHRQLDEYTKKEAIPTLVRKVPPPDLGIFDFTFAEGFDLKRKNGKMHVVMNTKGKELAKRKAKDFFNSVDNISILGKDSLTDKTDKRDDEEQLLEKEELFREYIWERTYLYSLLNGSINSIQDIVKDLKNKKNRSVINDLDMILFLPYYEEVLSRGNFTTLDSLERGIKAVQARIKNDDGSFFAEGFFECVMGLNRISSNEVFTPQVIAELLLDKKGFDRLENLEDFSNNSKTLIDNGDKSGMIVYSMVRKLKENNLYVNPDNFYSIPTSPIAYQITCRIFKELGLNVDNVLFVHDVDALSMNEILVDMINENDFNFDNIKDIRVRKELEKIMDDFKEITKFDYAISNPPYQNDVKDTSAKNIYPEFILYASYLSDKSVMIHPARAFIGASKADKEILKTIASNEGFAVKEYIDDSKKIFPSVDIKGGIMITSFDKSEQDGQKTFQSMTLSKEVLPIIDKIKSKNHFSLTNIIIVNSCAFSVYAQEEHKNILNKISTKTLTTSVFDKIPEIFDDSLNKNYTKIFGRENGKRIIKKIDNQLIVNKMAGVWKVLLPASNGSGKFGERLSLPIVAGPDSGSTQTFLSLGNFTTKNEAEALCKYTKTKFVRAMLGTLKRTQHNNRETWQNVPNQDFSTNSHIDWSKTIPNIDEQLFKYYELDENEKQWIKDNVKEMN